MYSDGNGLSTLASATDGVMTRWEPSMNYWAGYLFITSQTTAGLGYLEIAIDTSKIRTILISAREYFCLPAYNAPTISSIGLQVSVGETLTTSTACFTLQSCYSFWSPCKS